MSEDEVLQCAIDYFNGCGYDEVYRTRAVSEGAIGGVDAILFSKDANQFLFLEAKGTATLKERRSSSFTNSLGALIKRIKFQSGYRGVEQSERFRSPEWKDRVAREAKFCRSRYILALTTDYEQTVGASLDPDLAKLLSIEVLIVREGGAQFLTLG